jgi:single-strand DNA-binding protein
VFQSITLLGRAGDDATLRYTPSGKAVASFSLAVDKGYGEKKQTLWFRCSCWEAQAEAAAKLITKGAVVLVVGELEEPRTYTAKDGEARVSLEVTARTWKLVGNVAPKAPDVSVDDSESIPF